MVTGSGAYVIHALLAQHIEHYEVAGMAPRLTLFPPLLRRYRKLSPIIHTAPDFGTSLYVRESQAVVTFHSYYLDDEALRYASPAQALFYKTVLDPAIRRSVARADRVTAVSDFVAKQVKEHLNYQGDVVVIKNGVDENSFQMRPSHSGRQCRILFVGKLMRRKGAHLLNYVANGIQQDCHVAYTGGLRDVSRQLDNPKLLPLGRIPHAKMPEVYRDSDILFFPTLREGLGLAAVEAMACGLPVVTTRCSALPEIIDDGKGGYLCDMNDGPQMLKRLRELIENPGVRQEMGEYNREKVLQEFRLGRMVDEYQHLFKSLQ